MSGKEHLPPFYSISFYLKISFHYRKILSKTCDGGAGSDLQVSINLDRDRQPNDIPVVKFMSYDEGSQSRYY